LTNGGGNDIVVFVIQCSEPLARQQRLFLWVNSRRAFCSSFMSLNFLLSQGSLKLIFGLHVLSCGVYDFS